MRLTQARRALPRTNLLPRIYGWAGGVIIPVAVVAAACAPQARPAPPPERAGGQPPTAVAETAVPPEKEVAPPNKEVASPEKEVAPPEKEVASPEKQAPAAVEKGTTYVLDGLVLAHVPDAFAVYAFEAQGDFGPHPVVRIEDGGRKIFAQIDVSSWNHAASLALGETGLEVAGVPAYHRAGTAEGWSGGPVAVEHYAFESIPAGLIVTLDVRKEYASWLTGRLSFGSPPGAVPVPTAVLQRSGAVTDPPGRFPAVLVTQPVNEIFVGWNSRPSTRTDVIAAHDVLLVLWNLSSGHTSVTPVATVSGEPRGIVDPHRPPRLAVGDEVRIQSFYGGLGKTYAARVEKDAIVVYELAHDVSPPDRESGPPGSEGRERVMTMPLPHIRDLTFTASNPEAH